MDLNHFRDIIKRQFELYPGMELSDLYKLVYQGVMGSGHAISSEPEAESRLRMEASNPGTPPLEEPLYEEISTDGEVLRINLRPYMAGGGVTGALLTAFVRTGREYRGSAAELAARWKNAMELQSVFSTEAMTAFGKEMEERGWPALHHSETYRQLYRPAYRVALRTFCLEAGIPVQREQGTSGSP